MIHPAKTDLKDVHPAASTATATATNTNTNHNIH
jgi:hypothetical protein